MNCTAVRVCSGDGGGGAAMRACVKLPPMPWGVERPSRRRSWTPVPTEEPMTAGLILAVARAQGCGGCIGDVTRVDLTGRKLVGGQPRDSFRDFVRLATVLVDGNRLTLEDFLGMPALRDLSLCANHLDHIPPYRGPDDWFTNLEMLDISNNPEIPFRHLTILGHLRKLKYLGIKNCKLTRLPRALRLPTLWDLDASGNPFGGHGSRVMLVLSRQPALRRLRLGGCGLRALPVLFTITDAAMLDGYTRGDEDEPETDTKACECWCHTTEYQRAPHELGDVCACWRCRLGRPCPDCGCHQRLPGGRGVCARPDPEVVEWARTPRGRIATALVQLLKTLAGVDAARLRTHNWPGDCDRGTPGRLFGVPVFVVPHEPFPRLEELSLWGNPLTKAGDVLAASTWPLLICVHVGDTPLAGSQEQVAILTHHMASLISFFPNGETPSSMSMNRELEDEEVDWLNPPKDKYEFGEEEEEEEWVGEEEIPEEMSAELEGSLRGSEDLGDQKGPSRPASVEFGAWRSSTSSSSTSVEPPPPLTKEERWQQQLIRQLCRHWDKHWVTRRPPPPPPPPRPVCKPGEPCLRRRPKPQPRPPTPEPEPLARCEAGGPCKATLRRILWKMAWGRLQHPPPRELLRPKVEKLLKKAGRDVAALFPCDERRPGTCSCCALAAG